MDEVLAANAAFYAAFTRRDLRALEELWAHRTDLACTHPGWEALVGRAAVLQSFRAILLGGGAPATLRCVQPTVHLLGADTAYVLCTEVVPGGSLAATNLFVREDGVWRLVHHHAAPIARLPSQPPPTSQPPPGMN